MHEATCWCNDAARERMPGDYCMLDGGMPDEGMRDDDVPMAAQSVTARDDSVR
jgi:hypothetical protein